MLLLLLSKTTESIYSARMDTRFLESFISVVEHGSFAEAARRTGLTPAAVAQRVSTLEREIDATLLLRSGRTVRPTEHGAAILDRSKSLIRDVRDLKAFAKGNVVAGELRIGAISTALTGLLPALLKLVADNHPKVDFYVQPGTSIDLYEQVVNGDLDLALIVQPDFLIPKTCEFYPLQDEPLIVIAPEGTTADDPHALLETEPLIRYDRRHRGGRLADDYLRRVGIQPHERFELDAPAAIAVMVNKGLGVSLLPDWSPPWPEGLTLRKLALPAPAPMRTVGLLWTGVSIKGSLITALLALMPPR